MTPEQALKTLDDAASLAPLQRQGHVVVQQAVQVLVQVLNERGPKSLSKDPVVDSRSSPR